MTKQRVAISTDGRVLFLATDQCDASYPCGSGRRFCQKKKHHLSEHAWRDGEWHPEGVP